MLKKCSITLFKVPTKKRALPRENRQRASHSLPSKKTLLNHDGEVCDEGGVKDIREQDLK